MKNIHPNTRPVRLVQAGLNFARTIYFLAPADDAGLHGDFRLFSPLKYLFIWRLK